MQCINIAGQASDLGPSKCILWEVVSLIFFFFLPSTELACMMFDEERSRKAKATDEQCYGTVFCCEHNSPRTRSTVVRVQVVRVCEVRTFAGIERFCSTWSRVKTRTWFVTGRYVKFWFCNTLLRFSLTWNPKTPGAAKHLPPNKEKCALPIPSVPKSKRWESRLTTKGPRWEKNREGEKKIGNVERP